MNTVAWIPRICAASATPCAWLPADAATTPRARSSSVSRESRTNAPRILNDPVRWRFSHFSSTGPPTSVSSHRDSSIVVRMATWSTRSTTASMSASVTVMGPP